MGIIEVFSLYLTVSYIVVIVGLGWLISKWVVVDVGDYILGSISVLCAPVIFPIVVFCGMLWLVERGFRYVRGRG